MSNRKTNHYINNQEFLNALISYKKSCEDARNQGKEDPKIPNYIGECFIKIAEHLSRKPCFSSYSFKDEMVLDGIENSLMYFRNFDPDKSNNPFSYFTQIIFYAFLRRIHKEKKQLYVKYKATEQVGILDENEFLEDSDGHLKQFELYDNISEFIHNFEQSVKKRKTSKKTKGIEKFIASDEILLETQPQ